VRSPPPASCRALPISIAGRTWTLPARPGAVAKTKVHRAAPCLCWCSFWSTMPDIQKRVDFAFGAPDRWRAACQALARHHSAGHEVVVYCTQAEPLRAFDTMLWGFEPTAFIPHVMADDANAAQT